MALQLLGRGMLQKQAAAELGVAESTMKVFVRRATKKLAAATSIQAVLLHQKAHRYCQRDVVVLSSDGGRR